MSEAMIVALCGLGAAICRMIEKRRDKRRFMKKYNIVENGVDK